MGLNELFYGINFLSYIYFRVNVICIIYHKFIVVFFRLTIYNYYNIYKKCTFDGLICAPPQLSRADCVIDIAIGQSRYRPGVIASAVRTKRNRTEQKLEALPNIHTRLFLVPIISLISLPSREREPKPIRFAKRRATERAPTDLLNALLHIYL